MHHPWTMAALAAGKHVLCEKPYTRHPGEVDVAWDAADAAGLVLMEAFMWRHTPQADRLVELLPSLGELVAVRATFSHRLRDDGDIRVSAELEGGSLMDVGCYCVSASRLLAGQEPDLVFGQQVSNAAGVDRRFAGLLRFPSGLTATFHCGFDSFSESLEVIGRDATIALPDPWHSTQGLLYVDGVEERVEAVNPYQGELDDMASAIRGERAPRLGRSDAMGQARTIEALYRSATSGSPVSL
jgi:predicted dehydrogenase